MSLPIRSDYLAFGRPDFSAAEIAAVTRVMQSGWIGMGRETIEFERELALFVEANHVVTVSSCTAGLHLALKVLGVGAGDEVICPTLTWCSSANAALYVGARPVLCDVNPHTFCAEAAEILAQVNERTRAVVVVHFGGRTVDIRALRAALPDRVAIVEDAAHALGGRYRDGTPVGSSGNLVCFSFYANKNLSTAEGGAVACSDDGLADRIRSLRQHALPVNAWQRFTNPQSVLVSLPLAELGFKANFTDLQSAIGRVQLARLPQMQQKRAAVSRRYLERLRAWERWIVPQESLDSDAHARHLFPVRIQSGAGVGRDELLLALRERNIGATVHYALLHRMPLYQHGLGPLAAAEELGDEILTLPISAAMSEADADYVCDHIDAIMRHSS